MDIISKAKDAARSPGGIRKFWRDGETDKIPECPIILRHTTDGQAWVEEPFSILAHAANEFGESFLALDISSCAISLLSEHPAKDDPALRRVLSQLAYSKALALLRTGAIAEAQELLEQSAGENDHDLEIAAALGRCHKDYAFLADNRSEKNSHLKKAWNRYLAAYESTGDVFPGINAAAIALWLGKRDAAEKLAREIESGCRARLATNPSDYWHVATLAEAQLIQRRKEAAQKNYARARRLIDSSRKWANLETTRTQARRICEHLQWDFSFLETAFRFPQVLVFSGHMFDRPGRACPRFPDSLEPKVRAKLRARLKALNPGFGVAAAACGSDFLFIEEMLALGADIRLVLPWSKEEFIRSSVDLKPGAGWVERFNAILERVTSVTYLSQQTEPLKSGIGHEYLNECISGLALIGARLLNAELVPVAVWDLKEGDGLGGTAAFVSFWKAMRRRVEIIPLPPFQPRADFASLQALSNETTETGPVVASGQEAVKTMLFADVVGYTKIPPQATERFVDRFLAEISRLVDGATQRPILVNTWGDAIYLVFDDVIAAGEFAIELRDTVERTDWVAAGLGTQLRLRISLHTGPVLLCVDPLIRQMTVTGAHVSHAARIEPVVNPGEIWASEGFAAHCAIAGCRQNQPQTFGLDYLGQKQLSKKYGTYSLFRLRSGSLSAAPPRRQSRP